MRLTKLLPIYAVAMIIYGHEFYPAIPALAATSVPGQVPVQQPLQPPPSGFYERSQVYTDNAPPEAINSLVGTEQAGYPAAPDLDSSNDEQTDAVSGSADADNAGPLHPGHSRVWIIVLVAALILLCALYLFPRSRTPKQ